MTLKQMVIEQDGEEGWKKLPRRLKRVFEMIDAHNVGKPPVTRKQLEDALS